MPSVLNAYKLKGTEALRMTIHYMGRLSYIPSQHFSFFPETARSPVVEPNTWDSTGWVYIYPTIAPYVQCCFSEPSQTVKPPQDTPTSDSSWAAGLCNTVRRYCQHTNWTPLTHATVHGLEDSPVIQISGYTNSGLPASILPPVSEIICNGALIFLRVDQSCKYSTCTSLGDKAQPETCSVVGNQQQI